MTTVQTMLARGLKFATALLIGACALTGCASKDDGLVSPNVLVSPFAASRGEVLLAVAPPMNESGVSTVDVLLIGDELVAALSEARGLSAVPMNRTLAAMSAQGLKGVRSPAEAKVLAGALGVDGVVVASVTAYDPYDPPKIGLALALYMKDAAAATPVDPRSLTGAYTDQPARGGTTFQQRPAASVVEHMDAANHEILIDLKDFARGRHDPKSALTWRRYTASMELYTQFAAYRTVRRLLEKETERLGAELAVAGTEGKETR